MRMVMKCLMLRQAAVSLNPFLSTYLDDVNRRTTLVFEHDMDPTGDDQTLYETREKLAELCRITVEDIPSEVPSLFTDMVSRTGRYVLRKREDTEERIRMVVLLLRSNSLRIICYSSAVHLLLL